MSSPNTPALPFEFLSICRGRDTGCPLPPSEIPASGIGERACFQPRAVRHKGHEDIDHVGCPEAPAVRPETGEARQRHRHHCRRSDYPVQARADRGLGTELSLPGIQHDAARVGAVQTPHEDSPGERTRRRVYRRIRSCNLRLEPVRIQPDLLKAIRAMPAADRKAVGGRIAEAQSTSANRIFTAASACGNCAMTGTKAGWASSCVSSLRTRRKPWFSSSWAITTM